MIGLLDVSGIDHGLDQKERQVLNMARTKGAVRPSDLRPLGVDPSYLGRLHRQGELLKSGRGIYTLADFPATESHSLVEATRAQSKSVVCLLSALSFHGVGTQLPHQVWIAVPYGSRITRVAPVPLRPVVMRGDAYSRGIETHEIEGVSVKVFGVAKTGR